MTKCRFLPMFCCHHPRRIAINPHTKDFGVGVKTCFHCGRHICPKCQWRDSHHTFCSRTCYRQHYFWQKVREIRWRILREANAISRSLYKKAAEIPIGNGFVPAILPLLALSSIHTYTTLSVRSYNPPAIHEVVEAEPKKQEIRNIPSQTSDGDNTLH